MDQLFQDIREAATPKAWTRGVELSRKGGVALERESPEEVVLYVDPGGRNRGGTVQLDLAGADWACTCDGDEDPCEHVAAGVIAWRQFKRGGAALPRRAAPKEARLGYRLSRTPQGLHLERRLVSEDGTETPLTYSLGAIVRARVDAPPVAVSAADREIEQALGTFLRGGIPRHAWPRLIDALAKVSDVRLDDAPIHISSERAGVLARLVDHGDRFLLTLEQDPSIEEVFVSGVVRCGDTLKAVGEPPLTAEEVRSLRQGVMYPAHEAARLVSEVLPDLESKVPVDVRTRRLPGRARRVPPRVVVATERDGRALSVLATLVYGEPAIARVDAGRVVPLGDGKTLPVRDEAAERSLMARTQQGLGLEVGRRAVFTGGEALAFTQRLEVFGAAVEGRAHERFFRAPSLVPRLEVGEADFDLRFESPGKGTVNGRTVLEAWQAGEDLVPLDGGGLAPLPADWLERFGPQLADLVAAKAGQEALPTCALPDLGRLCDALERPRPPALAGLAALLGADGGLPEAVLPGTLTATLRDYQRDGVRWLSFLRRAGLGGLLADDMGLGKTLQALAVLDGKTLVVCPTSVLHNWAAEAARFRPDLKVSVYHGAKRALDPAADLTLTTYALLRLDADRLAARTWDTVVLDEAQNVKNPDSQVARAAFGLKGRFRIALTGTPVENRLEELWSQMHFANPGLLAGRSDFQDRYAKPIGEGVPGAAPRLRERIAPFLLRRLKRDVAKELPPRTDVVLRCALSDSERKVYDAIRAATREEIVAQLSAGGSVLAALEALLRLRQAACHPSLVPGQSAESSAKVALLMETLDEALSEGHKALVFSQWTSLLDLVEPHLEQAGVPFVRLDGSTADRGGVVARFQADDGPPVMLVSLKAGGAGLNLTAADHVFLLDPWWNPAVEDQAADRAHRIGQDRPVLVHRLVAEDTVDERIVALQEAKRELAEAALGEGDRAAGLTRADLMALLD